MKDFIENFDLRIQTLLLLAPKGVTLAHELSYSGPKYVYSSYPQDWQDRYARLSFLLQDPVVLWVQKCNSNASARWSEVPTYGLKKVFREAKERELNYGLVSVAIQGRKKSFMTLARQDREFTDEEISTVDNIFREFFDEAVGKSLLPEGEVELLDLLSTSLTQKEIAEKLGISVRGVEYRKAKILKSLDVDCIEAAIRKAARIGILE